MEIELGRILRAIRRFWWMPVVAALLLGALGFAAPSFVGKSYSATTQLLVTPLQEGSASIAQDGNLTSTFQGIITTGPVLDLVIRNLDLDMTREELAGIISVRPVSGTQILEITVNHSDPQMAADIVNSVADSSVVIVTEVTQNDLRKSLDDSRNQVSTLNDQITVIDTRLAELDTPENEDNAEAQAEIRQLRNDRLLLAQTQVDLQSTIRELNTQLAQMSIPITVLEKAGVPANPDQMSRPLLAIVGAFVGAVLGAALMILRELMDTRVHDVNELGTILQAPVQTIGFKKQGNLGLAAARVRGVLPNMDRSLLVSPHTQADLAQVIAGMGLGSDLSIVNGLLDDANAVDLAQNRDHAVVAVKAGAESLEDVELTAASLRDMGVNVVGGILLK